MNTETKKIFSNPRARVPVWHTVVPEANGMSGRYEAKLEKAGFKLRGSLAEACLSFLPTAYPIKVVRVTPADLGFASTATFNEIMENAATHGLSLCTHEIAIALRLAYKTQPVGEIVRIAMEPSRNDKGQREILTLERRRDYAIVGSWRANPDDRYQPTYMLAFVQN